MVNFLVSTGVILTLFISTYGWGRAIVRLVYGSEPQPIAFSAAVGCAFWVFIGGILNVFHAIGMVAIDALVLGGIGLALLSIYSSTSRLQQIKSSLGNPCSWVMVILVGYFALTLTPTAAFNYHDDFHAYLVYPFRMLLTGTADAGPNDLLGYGALGAQSFFHSILLLHLPIRFVNAFDLLFCFLVGGLLIDNIGKRAGLNWRYRLFPLFAFIVINPQFVNISSLYSGSLMVLGLIYASILAVENQPANFKVLILKLLPLGLFAAAIGAFKMTFLGFLAAYLMLFVLCLPLLGWRIQHVLFTGAFLLAATIIFTAPWFLLSFDGYIELAGKATTKMIDTQILAGSRRGASPGPGGLFSVTRLFWGGSYVGYLLMLMTLGVTAILSLKLIWNGTAATRDSNLIIGLCAFAAILASVFLLSYQERADLVIRYSSPLLIAVFPLTVALLGSSLPFLISSARMLQISAMAGMLLVGQALVIGQFADVFASNLKKSYMQHTIQASPIRTQAFFDYIDFALHESTRKEIRRAQNKVPEGAPLFAWLATPFHLNFARNPVIALDTPGLAVLAASYDFRAGPQEFEAYLRARGIRYLVWSRQSPGMRNKQELQKELDTRRRRNSARRNLSLIRTIEWLMNNRVKLFDQKGIVVIDIGEGS